jgi:hypothetical protein
MSDAPTPTPPVGTKPPKAPPNYAARRMIVTTVAIMAIVAFAVVGFKAVRGNSAPSRGNAGSWSEIALVDRSTGKITVVDDEGAVVREEVGRGRVTEVHTVGGRMALVGSTQIVLTGGDEPQTVPIGRTDTVTPIRTHDGLHLIVGSPSGGNVMIIDVVTGEILDVGALAKQAQPQLFDQPLLFAETVRWSSDATSFAVADAASFQTIVVRQGSDEVAFFGSQPVALTGDRVATSQIIGGQADIELFDYERNSKTRVPAPIPAGGVMVDDELVMVAIDGGVYRVESGQQEAQRVGQIAVPSGATVTAVQPTFDGDRLVVTGSVFEAVVGLDGKTLFTTTFTTAIDTDPVAADWRCVPVGGDDTYHSLVALDTGDQLADLSGVVVTGVSSDGCTVLGERNGVAEVISTDGVVSLGRVRAATLGPDGRTVVRTSTTGTTEILRIGDDLRIGEFVDLADTGTTNALVAFLD